MLYFSSSLLTNSNLSLAVTVVDPDREHYSVARNVLNFAEQVLESEGRAPWTYDQVNAYQRVDGARSSNR